MRFLAQLLIVNDSRSFSQMAAHILGQQTGLPVSVCSTLNEANTFLSQHAHERTLVITGLSLADANGPEVVKHFTDLGLRVVVVTANFEEETRNRILTLPVVDYVLKDSPSCIEHLVHLVRSLERNRQHTALVVDDSRTLRQQTSALLSLLGFHVLEAENGVEGVAQLNAHPHISLVITDYDMPEMDGLEMTRRMRQSFPREKLAIIGLSGQLSYAPGFLLSPRFLKCGANDFLHKPYVREEFQCRVEQNIEALDSYTRLRNMATKDYLTGLWNRRHFFATAPSLMKKARMASVAMLDIDFFKRVNDTHGHDAGDTTLRMVADCLNKAIRGSDMLARFGGEEFCLLSTDLPADHGAAFYEQLRHSVSEIMIPLPGGSLKVTVSIGVCNLPDMSLAEMIAQADAALYASKTGGRNRVTFAVPDEN